jgi:hypothetical protein
MSEVLRIFHHREIGLIFLSIFFATRMTSSPLATFNPSSNRFIQAESYTNSRYEDVCKTIFTCPEDPPGYPQTII